jgi:hypothetical protein
VRHGFLSWSRLSSYAKYLEVSAIKSSWLRRLKTSMHWLSLAYFILWLVDDYLTYVCHAACSAISL